jgi:hypothetical protein
MSVGEFSASIGNPTDRYLLFDIEAAVNSGDSDPKRAGEMLTDATRRIHESFDREPSSRLFPDKKTMDELVELFQRFVLRDQNVSEPDLSPEDLCQIALRIVQQLTDADCVFVRKLNVDGSVEIVSKLCWKPDITEFGRPPHIKEAKQGISSLILSRPLPHPTVVADINSADVDDDLRRAHQSNFQRSNLDADESSFLRSIVAEICIPLTGQGGRAFGAIVGVRTKPYSRDDKLVLCHSLIFG